MAFKIKPATWQKGHPTATVPTPPTDRAYRDISANILYTYTDGVWVVVHVCKPMGS